MSTDLIQMVEDNKILLEKAVDVFKAVLNECHNVTIQKDRLQKDYNELQMKHHQLYIDSQIQHQKLALELNEYKTIVLANEEHHKALSKAKHNKR